MIQFLALFICIINFILITSASRNKGKKPMGNSSIHSVAVYEGQRVGKSSGPSNKRQTTSNLIPGKMYTQRTSYYDGKVSRNPPVEYIPKSQRFKSHGYY